MKKRFSFFLLIVLAFSLLLSPFKTYGMRPMDTENLPCNKKTVNLINKERKLWSDHVLWTRNFIISDLESLKDKNAVLQRLLKNQEDLGNSIKPYYGEKAGNEFAKLLKEHIVIAGQVVDAAKSGNKANFEKFNKQWHKNADQIADFLSKTNPNWSKKTAKDMLYKHLQFITEEVTARLNKDWKKNIEAFDRGINHMLMFADFLSHGIIKQFPNRFKS